MIESIAWAALLLALNVRWKWYLCGFWSIFSTFPNHKLFFPLFAPFHDITFISHAKVHDIIPIAWNQITRVHFSSYLDFVFTSFSLVAFFPRSLTFARFGILSLPDCFHRLSYCQPFPFRSSFTASFSHEAYFDVSLAYYCFSFSNGYLIPVFLCTRFYYSF